jgi:hypothetical protein
MKTRIRIFCPFFEWNETLELVNTRSIGRGKFSSVVRCRIKGAGAGRDEADQGQDPGDNFKNLPPFGRKFLNNFC